MKNDDGFIWVSMLALPVAIAAMATGLFLFLLIGMMIFG